MCGLCTGAVCGQPSVRTSDCSQMSARFSPLAAAFVACVTVAHADVHERFQLEVRLRFDSSIAAKRIAEGLKNETECIWRPYGLELRWTDASPPSGMFIDAIVEPRFERPEETTQPTTLGRAVVRLDTRNWEPVRVSFDATKSVLAHRTTSEGASVTGVVLDGEMARALGRVLAHEIGHVLIGLPNHERQGLMRPNFSPEELAKPDRSPFRLTCGNVHRLEGRLRALSEPARLTPRRIPASVDPDDHASCIATRAGR